MKTKMACPAGYKLVNGKCVSKKDGKAIAAPYVSKSGKFFPDNKSLISGCNKNPNSPECKKAIEQMPQWQKSKIKGLILPGGKMQKLGGATAGAKPKAMYGIAMKPTMMRKGGTKKK